MSCPKHSPRMSQSAAHTQHHKRATGSSFITYNYHCRCETACSEQRARADMYHQVCYTSRCHALATCVRIICSDGVVVTVAAEQCRLILPELRLTRVLTNIRLLPGQGAPTSAQENDCDSKREISVAAVPAVVQKFHSAVSPNAGA
jgi:hypothetical protein